MKMKLSALALAAITLPLAAQEARVGVSTPDDSVITATPEQTPTARPKPSAAVPATPRAAGGESYGAYVPYTGPKRADASVVASAVPMTEEQADATVITSVVERPGELREGTMLRARINERLSTVVTQPGSKFTAELVEPVEKNGRVVLPVGATIHGRVTTVHGGKRISGAALIHLEAESVVLPDGTRLGAHMQLIDTDQTSRTRIDSEGSLVRRDHPKETLAAIGLATGGAAVAGGMLGGGVGAAVGAGVGAGAGTILWLKQDRQESVPDHALLVFTLSEAMQLTPQSETTMSRVTSPVAGDPDARVVGVE